MTMREGDDLDFYAACIAVRLGNFHFCDSFNFSQFEPDYIYHFLVKYHEYVSQFVVTRLGQFYDSYSFNELERFRADWCDE